MTSDSPVDDLAAKIADRATEDPAFRAYVITDPRAAISAVFGVTIPEGVEISVHQSTPTHMHIALAPRFPGDTGDDLGKVSGGGNTWKKGPTYPQY